MPSLTDISDRMEHDHYGRAVTRQPRRNDMPYSDYDSRDRRRPSRSPRRDSRRPKPNYFRDEPKKDRFGPPIIAQPHNGYPPAYPMPALGAPPGIHGGPPGMPGGPPDGYFDDDDPRDWSSGLFDCTMDQELCLCTLLNPLYTCMKMEEFEESFVLPCAMGILTPFAPFAGVTTTLRALERDRLNIEGSVMEDCCVSTVCGPCAFCQLVRERRMVDAEARGEVYPPPKGDRRPSRYYDDDRYDDRRGRGRRDHRRDSYYEEDPYARF